MKALPKIASLQFSSALRKVMERLNQGHRCVALVSIWAAVGLFVASAEAAERPNIAFVLDDDPGWAELGCSGNTFNETPNIDRLARVGMRLTQE